MSDEDIPQAATATAEAFGEDIGAPQARHLWELRLRHALRSDPEGSFVTERRGIVTGAAQAVLREGLWVLSLLAVSPSRREGGEGRRLVDAALGYGRGCDGGLIIASNDPRALRLYASSGFTLEATFTAHGRVDAGALPRSASPVEPVSAEGIAGLAPISRAVRGAAHGADLSFALDRGASITRLEDRGFVVSMPGQGVWALAAQDEAAARELLWSGLAERRHEPRVAVSWVGGRQRWALEVLLEARLSLSASGAIATRGRVGPLHPYIPSPAFA